MPARVSPRVPPIGYDREVERGFAISVAVALALSSCLVSIGDVDPKSSSDGGAGSGGAGGSAGSGASAGASATAGAGGSATDGGDAAESDAGNDAATGCSLTYQDDFADGVAASFWEVVGAGAATVVEKGGLLVVEFPSVVDKSFFAGYRLTSELDLSLCSTVVRADTVPPNDEAVAASFGVFFGPSDYAEFIKTGDRLHFQYFVNDAQTYLGNELYDPDLHRWWRFRHDGSALHWETSSDGTSWNTKSAAALSPELTALRLGGTTFQAESDVTGSVAFDDFKLLP